jgi:hypothetical protein
MRTSVDLGHGSAPREIASLFSTTRPTLEAERVTNKTMRSACGANARLMAWRIRKKRVANGEGIIRRQTF